MIYRRNHSDLPVLVMGKLFIVIDDEVERRLRLATVLRGGRKGDLSATIEEAVEEWLKKHSREIRHDLRL